MTPAAAARLAQLSPELRAFARDSAAARRHLADHVRSGRALGWCLARIAAELGDDAVRARVGDGAWCGRRHSDGLRCRALGVQRVARVDGSEGLHCDGCADWLVVNLLGRVVG